MHAGRERWRAGFCWRPVDDGCETADQAGIRPGFLVERAAHDIAGKKRFRRTCEGGGRFSYPCYWGGQRPQEALYVKSEWVFCRRSRLRGLAAVPKRSW